MELNGYLENGTNDKFDLHSLPLHNSGGEFCNLLGELPGNHLLDTILLHAIEVDVFPLLDPFSWNM